MVKLLYWAAVAKGAKEIAAGYVARNMIISKCVLTLVRYISKTLTKYSDKLRSGLQVDLNDSALLIYIMR